MEELAPYHARMAGLLRLLRDARGAEDLTRGSGGDFGLRLWRQWKTHAVAGQRCWNSGYVRGLAAIPPGAVAARGTSPQPRLCQLGFRTATSTRSDFRHWSRKCCVTNSNRRVRTRTHGGVAGIAGDRRPYAESTSFMMDYLEQRGRAPYDSAPTLTRWLSRCRNIPHTRI